MQAYVSLEGIAHSECLDLSLEEWRRAMDLGRTHGWKLPDERLWSHFYSPIAAPEPMPAREARHLADALEGTLIRECTHGQCGRDPRTPVELLAACATPAGRQGVERLVAFLRRGGFYASST